MDTMLTTAIIVALLLINLVTDMTMNIAIMLQMAGTMRDITNTEVIATIISTTTAIYLKNVLSHHL